MDFIIGDMVEFKISDHKTYCGEVADIDLDSDRVFIRLRSGEIKIIKEADIISVL